MGHCLHACNMTLIVRREKRCLPPAEGRPSFIGILPRTDAVTPDRFASERCRHGDHACRYVVRRAHGVDFASQSNDPVSRKAGSTLNTTQATPGAGTFVVIANPASRRKPGPIVEVLHSMAPADTEVEIIQTHEAGTTTNLARASLAGANMMVAVGGDSTVASIASAIDGTGVPLGIVPAGSTNIIARDLGIPTEAKSAIALLYGQHNHRFLDLGICDDRRFLHMAGAGFDSRLFAATNPKLKRHAGWLAYIPAGAQYHQAAGKVHDPGR